MVFIGADIELVPDAFFEQQAAKRFVLAAADVTFGGPEHDQHFPEGGIGSTGQEVHRVIKVYVIVVVAVYKGPDIEYPAHGKAMRGEGGMTAGKIHGMVSAEAAAGDGDPVAARLADGAGYDLVQDQLVIKRLMPGPAGRGDGLIVPAVGIEAVRAIDLYFSVVQEPACGFNEALVFVLVIGAF